MNHLDHIKLNVSSPAEPIPPGRGFYQLEEEALFVQVGVFNRQRRFYSYLEADNLLLEFDRRGRLIFMEVSVPRRLWQTKAELSSPPRVEAADVRWLDFRSHIRSPVILTNGNRSVAKVVLDDNRTDLLNYYLAQSIILQVDGHNRAAAVWVTDIIDDSAGQEIADFRKGSRHSEAAEV
ncbi:MAG: hypothetical protein JSW34_07515 [Candidatus Zixiibacteriota bacterium]|nr:MAG: hypothetical protein JSW34_07515 [candidate division Zixibacteria bacterium]